MSTNLQLKWIDKHQIDRLGDDAFKKLHIPQIPGCTPGCRDGYRWSDESPAQQAEVFRSNNQGFPVDIDDDEILKRYVPARFPSKVSYTFETLAWIPEYDEVIEMSDQLDLLGRIWDGRETYLVDATGFAEDGVFCEYAYWIDFENKIMEVTGVIDGVLTLTFKELKVGILSKLNAEYWKGVKAAEALERLVT